ncbi:hypothetical protein NEOKW01_1657 [Nematocida sp. AWRm80]|nr:hypothetical protein NEOKW01_1657 [Nematocida sp. AWRm80]
MSASKHIKQAVLMVIFGTILYSISIYQDYSIPLGIVAFVIGSCALKNCLLSLIIVGLVCITAYMSQITQIPIIGGILGKAIGLIIDFKRDIFDDFGNNTSTQPVLPVQPTLIPNNQRNSSIHTSPNPHNNSSSPPHHHNRNSPFHPHTHSLNGHNPLPRPHFNSYPYLSDRASSYSYHSGRTYTRSQPNQITNNAIRRTSSISLPLNIIGQTASTSQMSTEVVARPGLKNSRLSPEVYKDPINASKAAQTKCIFEPEPQRFLIKYLPNMVPDKIGLHPSDNAIIHHTIKMQNPYDLRTNLWATKSFEKVSEILANIPDEFNYGECKLFKPTLYRALPEEIASLISAGASKMLTYTKYRHPPNTVFKHAKNYYVTSVKPELKHIQELYFEEYPLEKKHYKQSKPLLFTLGLANAGINPDKDKDSLSQSSIQIGSFPKDPHKILAAVIHMTSTVFPLRVSQDYSPYTRNKEIYIPVYHGRGFSIAIDNTVLWVENSSCSIHISNISKHFFVIKNVGCILVSPYKDIVFYPLYFKHIVAQGRDNHVRIIAKKNVIRMSEQDQEDIALLKPHDAVHNLEYRQYYNILYFFERAIMQLTDKTLRNNEEKNLFDNFYYHHLDIEISVPVFQLISVKQKTCAMFKVTHKLLKELKGCTEFIENLSSTLNLIEEDRQIGLNPPLPCPAYIPSDSSSSTK